MLWDLGGQMIYYYKNNKKESIYYKKIQKVYHTGSLAYLILM